MENLEKQIVRIIENNSPELAAEEILRLGSRFAVRAGIEPQNLNRITNF